MATIKKCGISIFLLFAFVLSGCSMLISDRNTGLPEKGVWYCEVLEIEVNFSEPSASYVTMHGSKVPCTIDGDYGSDWFLLGSLSSSQVFFKCECDYWDEDKMLVTEYFDNEGDVKGASYLFVRVDK
jgi:hypothetical protein